MSESSFGELLRHWRARAGLSQLDLALEAGVSQRHLSFLESGRSQPTQAMVLGLAQVLEVPLREQNTLLTAAGFPALHTARDLDDPALASVRHAIQILLRQQEPYPAMVADRYWNLIALNGGAERMFAWLLQGMPPEAHILLTPPPNLLRLMLHPYGLRHCLVGWESLAQGMLLRLERDMRQDGPDSPSAALYHEVYTDIPPPQETILPLDSPLLASTFQVGGTSLSFFSTITTLGTPRDITLQELRIESFFPADSTTEACLHRWAKTHSDSVTEP